MNTTRKILLVCSLILFVVLLAAGGLLTVFILQPARIQQMVEESLSRATGTDLTIGTLSFSRDPLSFSCFDIRLKQKGAERGFLLHIPTLSAEMALEGRLGRRTLAVRELTLPDFSLVIARDAAFPEADPDAGTPSLPVRAAIRIVSFLLFRDIRLERGSIGDGSIRVDLREGTIRVHRVHARFEASRPPEVTCSAEVRLGNGQWAADLPRLRVTAPQTLSLQGPVSADVVFDGGTLRLPGMEASHFSGNGHFNAGPLNRISFEPLHLTASPMTVSSKAGRLRLDRVRVSLHHGVIDVEGRTVSIPEITVGSSLIPDFRAGLEADARRSRITLAAEKVGIPSLLQSLHLLPPGWRLSGEDDFQGYAVIDEEGWSVSGTLMLRRVDFQDPAGDYAAEGLSLAWEFTARGGAGQAFGIRYSAKVEKGEVLLRRTYIDLNKNGFHASGHAEIELPLDRALSTFNMKLDEILHLSGRAAMDFGKKDPSLVLLVHIPENPVGPVFRHFVSEPLRLESPFLGGVSASGGFSADVELHLGSEWRLKGRCRMMQGSVSAMDPPLQVQGIELDLPFLLGSGKVLDSAEQNGWIRAASMQLPSLPVQTLSVETSSGPNALLLKGPISLMLPGGTAEIGSISISELTAGPAIQTSLSVRQLDMDPILSRIWRRSVGGRLTGRLDPVHYARGTISADGALKADLFGGEAVVEKLGAAGLFSFPVFSMDLRWEDISLLELSRDTPFGRIQGVMRGRVKDLEIAQMQPQSFDLFLETVRKKGVPQEISIHAVDNIARIGSGQSPFKGGAGLLSVFFREFSYSKIGVRAVLENDTFRINGTIKEGDVEYLVKRGSFSGVNVVNQNPDNRISFKDMLKRLQRIGSPGSAPEIR